MFVVIRHVSLFTNMAEAVAIKPKNKPRKHKKVVLLCSEYYVKVIDIVWQYASVFCAFIYVNVYSPFDLWY